MAHRSSGGADPSYNNLGLKSHPNILKNLHIGRSARPAPRRAPAPAPVRQAQSGSGGGIGSVIAEGMAFGFGSAIAHRAVDALFGPRTIKHETVVSAAPAPTASSMDGSDACSVHSKAFQDCNSNFGSNISKCQFYMDMLSDCKKNNRRMSIIDQMIKLCQTRILPWRVCIEPSGLPLNRGSQSLATPSTTFVVSPCHHLWVTTCPLIRTSTCPYLDINPCRHVCSMYM